MSRILPIWAYRSLEVPSAKPSQRLSFNGLRIRFATNLRRAGYYACGASWRVAFTRDLRLPLQQACATRINQSRVKLPGADWLTERRNPVDAARFAKALVIARSFHFGESTMSQMQDLIRAIRTGAPLPTTLDLDRYCSAWFAALWNASIVPSFGMFPLSRPLRCETVREHGAALGLVDDGFLVCSSRAGSPVTFPLLAVEMRTDGFVGYVHTHPYASGLVGAAFSRWDFIAMLKMPWLQLLCAISGEYVFLIVRNERTRTLKSGSEEANFLGNFESRLDFLSKSWRFQSALLIANLEVCPNWGLGFYIGRLGSIVQFRLLQSL